MTGRVTAMRTTAHCEQIQAEVFAYLDFIKANSFPDEVMVLAATASMSGHLPPLRAVFELTFAGKSA